MSTIIRKILDEAAIVFVGIIVLTGHILGVIAEYI